MFGSGADRQGEVRQARLGSEWFALDGMFRQGRIGQARRGVFWYVPER